MGHKATQIAHPQVILNINEYGYLPCWGDSRKLGPSVPVPVFTLCFSALPLEFCTILQNPFTIFKDEACSALQVRHDVEESTVD